MRNGTRIIAFPGSFDLFTNGHLWVVEQAAKLATSKVIVLVAKNPNKTGMFTIDERVEMIESSLQEAGIHHFEVHVNESEYTADWAEEHEARMIRGIRNAADLDYERMVNATNSDVFGGEQTLFLLPPEDIAMISSSYVKSLIGPIGWHHQVKKFLPNYAYHMLIQKWLKKEWDQAIGTLRKQQWPHKDLTPEYSRLLCQYVGEDRVYHTLVHIAHCISELQRVELTDVERAKLVLAIFYHDYTQFGDNAEWNSGYQALYDLKDALQENVAFEIQDLIEATAHKQPKENPTELERIMISVDLAILGRPQDEYEAYAEQVRKEYPDFDDVAYSVGRSKILQVLIDRAKADQLYPDYTFRWKYNNRAIQNMKNEWVKLQMNLPVVDELVEVF